MSVKKTVHLPIDLKEIVRLFTFTLYVRGTRSRTNRPYRPYESNLSFQYAVFFHRVEFCTEKGLYVYVQRLCISDCSRVQGLFLN
jgi:hypothetical protein